MALPPPPWFSLAFDALRLLALVGLGHWIVLKGRGALRPRDGSRVGGLFFSLLEFAVMLTLAQVVIVAVEAALTMAAIRHGVW